MSTSFNYHAGLVWAIDRALFFALLALGALIIAVAFFKEYSLKRRARRLAAIKKNIFESILSKDASGMAALSRAGAKEFLDVAANRNRDAVFFNEAEQKLFRDSFATPQKLLELERAARRGNKWRRVEAILSLGCTRDASVLKVLRKTIFEKNDDIAYFSILALGQIKTKESAEILFRFLKKDISAGFKIASVLADFPPQAAEPAVKLFKDRSPQVRFWAAKAISRSCPSHYLKDVEELARDSSPEVRAVACECLASIGSKDAEKALSECLKDDFWLVRANAAKALSAIFGKGCIPRIIPLVNDGSLSVIEAVKEIVATHIEASLPYIEKFLSGKDDLARRLAVEALETSHYVAKMFRDILSGSEDKKAQSTRLLEAMIGSQELFGLEAALVDLNKEERDKLAGMIKGLGVDL